MKGNVDKRKDLWKTLKSLGLFKKISVVQIIDNKCLKSDLKSMAQTFAKSYFKLPESWLKIPRNSPSKFDMSSVHQYYKKLELGDNFNLTLTTKKKSLEILQCTKISKPVGTDRRWCKNSGKTYRRNM